MDNRKPQEKYLYKQRFQNESQQNNKQKVILKNKLHIKNLILQFKTRIKDYQYYSIIFCNYFFIFILCIIYQIFDLFIQYFNAFHFVSLFLLLFTFIIHANLQLFKNLICFIEILQLHCLPLQQNATEFGNAIRSYSQQCGLTKIIHHLQFLSLRYFQINIFILCQKNLPYDQIIFQSQSSSQLIQHLSGHQACLDIFQ
ncbi:hypothetical protein ABPG72_011123 [Tetrahymena utriculariae]